MIKKMTEKDLQIQVCDYLKLNKNILSFFMVPNGVKLGGGIPYYNSLLRQGFKTGVSDLVVVLKNKVLFLELKVGKNKQSENQILFENSIKTCNVVSYYVIKSLEDLQEVLKNV